MPAVSPGDTVTLGAGDLALSTAEDSGFEVPAFWDRVKKQP